jgi:hypothetical protein
VNGVMNALQWLLPLVMAVVAVIALLANFKGTFEKCKSGDFGPITVALLTSLCIAYGIERAVNVSQSAKQLSDLQTRISQLQAVVTRNAGGQPVIGKDAIYRAADRLCNSSEDRIRTVLISTRPSPAG